MRALPDGSEIGFVDVPGHERFLPNMLAGVLSIDRVLLVVAADDGPRPQTIEHLDILELIGVAEITAVVTKIDRVTPARVAAVTAEVAALLAAAGHRDSPTFAGFEPPRRRHRGADPASAGECRSRPARPRGDAAGRPLSHGDRPRLRPARDRARRHRHGRRRHGHGRRPAGRRPARQSRSGCAGCTPTNHPIETAVAGERCAVNIIGSFPGGAEPRRGDWLLTPERLLPVARLDLVVRASRHSGVPLRDGLPAHLHIGTEDVVGRAAVLSGSTIAPGETGFVQLDLDREIVALAGDRAVLRDHAARITLAGGRVVDPLAPRRGRRRPARLALLAAMTPADPAAALGHMLAAEGIVDLARFALLRNLTGAELAALGGPGWLRLGPAQTPLAITAERLAALTETVAAALAEWHRAQPDMLGPTGPALAAQLRGAAPAAALEAALDRLADGGRAVREGGMWRLAEHRPRLGIADEKLWQRLRPLIAEGGLRPPRVREIAAALALEPAAVERLLRRAARLGRVAKVAENRYFLPESLERLAAIARDLAAQSPSASFTAALFNERAGVGRNLTIAILEYLDKMGATRRVGDARIVLRGGEFG